MKEQEEAPLQPLHYSAFKDFAVRAGLLISKPGSVANGDSIVLLLPYLYGDARSIGVRFDSAGNRVVGPDSFFLRFGFCYPHIHFDMYSMAALMGSSNTPIDEFAEDWAGKLVFIRTEEGLRGIIKGNQGSRMIFDFQPHPEDSLGGDVFKPLGWRIEENFSPIEPQANG